MPTKDKLLFTPGPLTTSDTVKAATARDLGSRDEEFLALVRAIRAELLSLASADAAWTAVPIQGSGTYAVEAAVTTAVPRDGKLLVLANGAYGARIAKMAAVADIAHATISQPEHMPVDPQHAARALAEDPAITHVALVHCETTTGLLNPLAEVAAAVADAGRSLLVDAMSSFGALPLDLANLPADFVVSSANKCIEGLPGCAFVLCRTAALAGCEGHARSLSLDLHAQWQGLERDGQFRFTPPTHVLLAFARALQELRDEGGVAARGARYAANQARIAEGMTQLGFETLLPPERQSPVITTFRYPPDPRFRFEALYRGLSERGFLIYPGKLTDAPCFRIGSVGRIGRTEVDALLAAVAEVCAAEGWTLDAPVGGPR